MKHVGVMTRVTALGRGQFVLRPVPAAHWLTHSPTARSFISDPNLRNPGIRLLMGICEVEYIYYIISVDTNHIYTQHLLTFALCIGNMWEG